MACDSLAVQKLMVTAAAVAELMGSAKAQEALAKRLQEEAGAGATVRIERHQLAHEGKDDFIEITVHTAHGTKATVVLYTACYYGHMSPLVKHPEGKSLVRGTDVALVGKLEPILSPFMESMAQVAVGVKLRAAAKKRSRGPVTETRLANGTIVQRLAI